MLTEDQNGPRRSLKGLWLLPIFALGLAVVVSSWKKPAPRQQTGFEAASQESQAKRDAYRQATYSLIGQFTREQPRGYRVTGFAPYKAGLVTRLGPARFRCSSSLTVRSQTGGLQTEHWQCVISGGFNSWFCEKFQHTPPERVQPGGAKQGAIAADRQHPAL